MVKECGLTEPSDAKQALIECETPRFGLYLEDVRPFEPPIKLRGQRGIWLVEMANY